MFPAPAASIVTVSFVPLADGAGTIPAAVKAVSAGESAPSQAVTYVTVPGSPATVSAAVLSKKRRQAQITWTAPTSDGGTPITSYSWRWYNSKTRVWSAVKDTPGLRGRLRWPVGTTSVTVEVWANNTQGASAPRRARLNTR